jgi:hypothetical protein
VLRAFRSAEWTRKAAVLGPLDDAQTCAFDIVLMPEGNRIWRLYSQRKAWCIPCAEKILRHNSIDQIDIAFSYIFNNLANEIERIS